MLDSKITSKIIKNARLKSELTQEELAGKLYVSKQAVSNWERGMNLPDEQIRVKIESVLNIKLHNENMNTHTCITSVNKNLKLKNLNEINEFDDIISSIEHLINLIQIDEYKHTIQKLLHLTLAELIGYEIYFEGHCHKTYSEVPIDWNIIASDLDSLINELDTWIVSEVKKCLHYYDTNMLQKIYLMSFFIGAELFEDFDEEGYRNNFVQQIGRYAEKCGYELVNILPSSNTDIMIIYKTAILDLINVMSSDFE